MNLNYDKIKAQSEHGGNAWTSYSDLFTVLSVLFLLLYVVANLRSGATSIASRSAVQQTKAEAEELRKQIKAYEVLKEDYVKKGASKEEVEMYQQLMGKLSLLEDEAKQEREALFKQAEDAKQKEENLNHYQQMVKNIITANLVSQANVKRRDQVIVEKEQTIGEKDQVIVEKERDIEGLNRTIVEKKAVIDNNNAKIAMAQKKLQDQVEELKDAYEERQLSKKKYEEKLHRLTADANSKIEGLRNENGKYVAQLQSAESKIVEKNREAEKLLADLTAKQDQYKGAIAELERAHQEGLAKSKAAFEDGLKRGNLAGDARVAKEREYAAGVEAKNKAYADKMKGLNQELENTKAGMKGLAGKYQAAIGNLEKANEGLKKDLASSIQLLNQQRALAEKLKGNLAKAGVHADVDPKTGDVTVNFGGEYFETGSANLKDKMKNVLEKLVPVYAGSLFQDPKVAKRIQAVEIVGFASPTYKGKYVNPDSLSAEDRAAVNYNMDLSYQRAKSIFEHVFDPNKMTFPYQKTLLPLVKVTGRSYLATERNNDRGISNISDDQYCMKFDCKKSQRVIIKFQLMDK